jgi:peptide/nickel transport system substrate-binding protein
MTARRALVAALLAGLVVCAGSFVAASGAEIAKRGGVLTYAVPGNPPTFDCHAANGFSTLHFVAPHYSTLLRIDPEHYPQITGDLAESWEVRDSGLTYVFHLHPGIRFHDGTALTAADVKASFDRIRNPPPGVVSVRKAQYADISSIDAPDDRTVIFHVARPNAAMMTLLASPWNCIYSSALLEANPDYPAKVVMGSGPFRFAGYVAGSKWSGRRFEGYFRPDLPYLDGFEAYVVSRPALITALQGGQVMATFISIAPAERDTLMQAMGDHIKFQDNTGITDYQIVFNTARKPFDDVRVRRALSLAIDRWTFEPVLRRSTNANTVGGLLRPGFAMARTPQELEELPGFSRDAAKDKAEARQLLKEAGQENLTFVLSNRAGDPYDTIGVYAVDQWRNIGVGVDEKVLAPSLWQGARLGGNFDVIIDFVSEFVDDPAIVLAHYVSFDRAPDNVSRAVDRTLDELFGAQLRATDVADRKALVQAFERRALEQTYIAPIAWTHRIVPLDAEVMGYVTTPSHYVDQDLATIWLNR